MKLVNHDFSWLTKSLTLFIVFYLLLTIYTTYFTDNLLYLDEVTVNITLKDINFSIAGEYLDINFKNLGAVSAFAVGSRLTATFLAKHPMSLGGKIATVISAGAGSSTAFHLANNASGVIRGSLLASRGTTDNSVIIKVTDVAVTAGPLNTSVDLANSPTVGTHIPKLSIQLQHGETISDKLNSLFYKNFLVKDEGKSKIIEMIEKVNSKPIEAAKDEVKNQVAESFSINAPLESSDLVFLQFKSTLIEILTSNLHLNLIMLYFIVMLIFIITCKYVLANKVSSSSLERLKSVALGKYLHYILSKIILGWQQSSIVWIYFILFFMLIFTSVSTYGLYACLFVLQD